MFEGLVKINHFSTLPEVEDAKKRLTELEE